MKTSIISVAGRPVHVIYCDLATAVSRYFIDEEEFYDFYLMREGTWDFMLRLPVEMASEWLNVFHYLEDN